MRWLHKIPSLKQPPGSSWLSRYGPTQNTPKPTSRPANPFPTRHPSHRTSLHTPSRLRDNALVLQHRQNPRTPAHGSPKTKPGILFSPIGHTLVFRQHQSTGRSRTRLAKAKSNRFLASPRRQTGGVCLPRSTLKVPTKTSLPPVSASHPPTRVGGSPRFAKLPPPHSWGGGARKGGGEVSEPGCHENQSSCPDYFRHHQSPGRSPTRLAKKPAWV